MCLTPFHYGVAYLIKRACKKLNLAGLAVGAVIPDIEAPIVLAYLIWIQGVPLQSILAREIDPRTFYVLHVPLYGIPLATALGVVAVLTVYRFVVMRLLQMDRVPEELTFSRTLVVSVFTGVVSHHLIDALHHHYNPLLKPFYAGSVNALVLFGNQPLADLVVQTVCGVLTLVVVARELFRGREGLRRLALGW